MKKSLAAIFLLAVATFPLGAIASAFIDLTPPAYADESGVEYVEVPYQETGHLLALVPVTLTATARAHASGEVDLEYPWYSFITVDKRDQIQSELKVAVDEALRKLDLGKVRAEGKASAENFSPEEVNAVSAAMRQVLRDRVGPGAQEQAVD